MGSEILSTPEFSPILSKSIKDVELRGFNLRRINEKRKRQELRLIYEVGTYQPRDQFL